jgi:starch synthase
MERKNVNAIKKWFEQSRKNYPAGSILVQSTTYDAWPYPALIYKRGTWAAVDLFFLLGDIPLTYMGEIEGHAFREKTTNVFSRMTKQADAEVPLQDPSKQKVQRKMKRRNSYYQSQDTDLGFGYNTHSYLQQTANYLQDI